MDVRLAGVSFVLAADRGPAGHRRDADANSRYRISPNPTGGLRREDFADLGDLLALAKSNVCLAELLNNLIGRVSCLLYLQRILSGRRPDAMLS